MDQGVGSWADFGGGLGGPPESAGPCATRGKDKTARQAISSMSTFSALKWKVRRRASGDCNGAGQLGQLVAK